MSLTAGTRLGPYEVTAQIGVGGMGEVYRATDTNLKRSVAIKVLPESVAADVERLARFQREAEVLAALNHPNIAAIYGLERSGGTTALVMELVEGPTLAEVIEQRQAPGFGLPASGQTSVQRDDERGQVPGARSLKPASARMQGLPVDEALSIARQIAEALEAAHENGIIHRDLKPANIKVRPDGAVKVLDFGLAKAMEPTGAMSPTASMSPTITTPAHLRPGYGEQAMTQAGMILGTAAYMSPEQARGKVVDKRSDIWAFGCVLYEMLSGRRAFPGEDVTDTLAAVVRAEPDWSLVPRDISPTLLVFLRRSFQKDPKQRVGDIRDVRLALEGVFEVAVPQAATPATSPSRGTRLAWVVAATAVVGLAVLTVMYLRVASVEPPETRLEILTPPGRLSFSKLSPDGRKVVFSAVAEGRPSQLWLRSFESEAAQPLAGTENAGYPFWSPDSRSIGFVASGRLMRLDLAGGSARSVANAPSSEGWGAWGADGTILFTPTATSPLYRVPAAGGPPVEVTHLSSPAAGASHRFPDFLPDGRRFLFFVAGTANVQGVYLGSMDTTDTRRLLESDSAAVFAEPDYVVFAREGNLLAQRMDLKTFETTGDPFSVAQQVSGDQGTLGEIAVSTSQTGLIAYRAPIIDPLQLTWFDRVGRQMGTLGDVETSRLPFFRISPDGRTVAIRQITNGNRDVWLIETARGVLRRFTSDPASEGNPVWAPDSNRVAFFSRRSGPQNLWLKRIDGGTEERLRESAENEVPTDWSPDGRFLLFSIGGLGGYDLYAGPLQGDGKPVAVATTGFVEDQGRFSPDSRSVAYQSNETGRNEIYVVPFPGPGVPTQVSTNGGVNPQWREDGREIFYLGPDSRLMAVPLMPQPNGRLESGTPTALFPIPQGAAYDVTSDGQRILVDKPVGQATTPPITVILNWKPRP